MNHAETKLWFPFFEPNPRAKLRLFCFPYAGAGASTFRPWVSALADRFEVCAIQYPGRETRSQEKPPERVEHLVDALTPALLPLLDRPFVFFGHSMGALVSFELIRALTQAHDLRPEHVFFSAAGAPHLPEPHPVHHLPGVEFLRELVRLKGIPPEILKNLEVMAYMLPILRADFKVCETYRYQVGEPLQCPITIFGGEDDERVERERLEGWRHHASLSFSMRMFRGGHFFIRTASSAVLGAIVGELGALANRSAAA